MLRVHDLVVSPRLLPAVVQSLGSEEVTSAWRFPKLLEVPKTAGKVVRSPAAMVTCQPCPWPPHISRRSHIMPVLLSALWKSRVSGS